MHHFHAVSSHGMDSQCPLGRVPLWEACQSLLYGEVVAAIGLCGQPAVLKLERHELAVRLA
jgi:hypothetical protein